MRLAAIALALDQNGFDVVKKSVQQCRGQGGVTVEDAGPLLVDPV